MCLSVLFAAPAPRCWCSFMKRGTSSCCKAGQGLAEPPVPHPASVARPRGVQARPSALLFSTREVQTRTSDLPRMSNPTITNPCARTKGRNSVCWKNNKKKKQTNPKPKKPEPLSVSRLGGARAGAAGTVQPQTSSASAAHGRGELCPPLQAIEARRRRSPPPARSHPGARPRWGASEGGGCSPLPVPALQDQPPALPAARNSCLLKVRQAQRLNAWLLNHRTTLALIRGSNYLENGGHGPRSFTLIEFQYLPLAAWAPGCHLKQLKAQRLPRLLSPPRSHQLPAQPAGEVRGAGGGVVLPAAPTRRAPVPPPLPKPRRQGSGCSRAFPRPRGLQQPTARFDA